MIFYMLGVIYTSLILTRYDLPSCITKHIPSNMLSTELRKSIAIILVSLFWFISVAYMIINDKDDNLWGF